MHPPQWVVDEIGRIAPHFRLAWDGERQKFAFIDLMPRRLADKTLKTPWENRGPIFGPRFDPLQRVPIWVDQVENTQDVFDGTVVTEFKRKATSLKKRLEEQWRARQAQYRHDISEMAGEKGERLHWRANRDCEGGTPYVTKDDLTAADKDVLTGEWKDKTLQDTPPVFPDFI